MKWDADIAAMELSDIEKNGMQVFRNYAQQFDAEARRQFIVDVDENWFDLLRLERLTTAISLEAPRLLPVIVCAYADEELDSMFKAHVPSDVPGGKAALFSGYGPLSSLASRVRLAFAFSLLSRDSLLALDELRKVRNRISHDWDHTSFVDLFERPPLSELYPIENQIPAAHAASDDIRMLSPDSRTRIRLIWLSARVTYESVLWPRAIKAGLDPGRTLYQDKHPKILARISDIAMKRTRSLINPATPPLA